MRAKIVIKTNLLDEDIRGRLREHDWLPDFDQDGPDATAIKERILETVADNHEKMAREGAKVVILKQRTETEGLISEEEGNVVFRIKNSNILVLQTECEELVRIFYDYARVNKKQLTFVDKIEVLEIKNHNRIIEGQAIPSRRERFRLARQRKNLEFIVAIGGAALLAVLLVVTYPWPSVLVLTASSEVAKWAFDLPSKAIGSVLITTISSTLAFAFFYNELKNEAILWSLPAREHVGRSS